MIPYGKHFLDQEDIDSVIDVLQNGALTQGPKINEFEKVITQYTGAKYAVAVSSGTAALHLACLVSNLGENDEVFTTTNTFVASSNCILYVGATPKFVDINPQTLNIDTELLDQACSDSPNPRAIIPVHFAGLPCDMPQIQTLAKKYGTVVIEDASHALGAIYQDGGKVGNCKYSDMTVFSFHPVKGITSGEGGMITTNDPVVYKKLLQLRSHGICKGNFEFPGISHFENDLLNQDAITDDGELKMWYYEMQDLGYNYRITDIQSVLAINQMKKIDLFLQRRKQLVLNYDLAFEGDEQIMPTQKTGRKVSSHHIYVVQIDFHKAGITRHRYLKELLKSGIGTQVHYIPVVMHPYYQDMGNSLKDFPITEHYYETALSIPLYYELSDEEQQEVIGKLKYFLQ